MRLARVFARRTKATPTDALAFVGEPGLFPPEVDAVHVSVAFTWDLRRAEELARAWAPVAPVSIGGPAVTRDPGDFEPGTYLREGYTVTSRGCPRACWFCAVHEREGDIRELPIRDGHNVLDSNLLACSDQHIRDVFAMLKRQALPAEFTGGLDSRLLRPWHVDALSSLKPKQFFLAYDDEGDLAPLRTAAAMLSEAGIIRPGHQVRCYVLVGYQGDTFDAAETRLREVVGLGIMPMAMLYRDEEGRVDVAWRRFQREWANAVILGAKMRVATEAER